MGFKRIYGLLQEVFPQIDARILRAVAIEHSKDADAAVEAVIVEIIPYITLPPDMPLTTSLCEGQSSEDAMGTNQGVHAVVSADGESKHIMSGVDQPHYQDGHLEGESDALDLALSGENLDNSIEAKTNTHGEHIELVDEDGLTANLKSGVSGDPETDETVSGLKCPGESDALGLALSGDNLENIIQSKTNTLTYGEYIALVDENGLTTNLKSGVSGDLETDEAVSDLKCPETSTNVSSDVGNLVHEKVNCCDFDTMIETATNKGSELGKSWADDQDSEIVSSFLTIPDLMKNSEDTSAHSSDTQKINVEEIGGSFLNASNIDVGTEDEPALEASMSQSSQIRMMEVLEEIIADAGNNKKTLFSGMESVIGLMREVELKEKSAQQTKVEASMGGANTLSKLEKLIQTVQRANEANDMHAGEVFGERAILATELRELQSRLLSLSDERDKSLSILDQMRQTLEIRLAAAENELKSAEQEKIEKEKAAIKALADQELIMEKVVQESKLLKQQAEENAILQEFLMDRGRVVDMLQGEIAVICKDVRLLKESLDNNVPFSKSLSSSQTSFLIASSSTSTSSKNLNPEESADADPLVVTEAKDHISCSAEWSTEGEPANKDDQKALVDDGWEIFDDCEVLG